MKQLLNILRVAYKSILKNRMRSLLTSLGIIIGVSAVIVMVSIGEGAQVSIQNRINALGTNLIIIFPGSSHMGGISHGAGSYNRFTLEDVDKLKKEATDLSGVSPVITAGGQVIGGGNNWSTRIYGVNTDYFTIRDWQLEYGEFFTDRDIRVQNKVAILGKTVADQLFPDQDPTGEKIRIRNVPFTVIGVLKSKGQSGVGMDQDDLILAPSTTVLYRLKGGRYIDFINASAVSQAAMPAAEKQIRTILRASHRLTEGEDDDFTIRSQEDISSMASETTKIMTLLLGSIAGVSLIVGGIGIMNIMLVSVTERTREIGIRLAVGARSSDVLMQFLTEAMVLSLTGGLIGILLSGGIVAILDHFSSIYAVIQPGIVVISVLFSGMVGVFFGFYPARKAANLNPIDALRYE